MLMEAKKDGAREAKMAIALLEALLIAMLAVAMITNIVSFAYGIVAEAALVLAYVWLLWASRKSLGGRKEHLIFFGVLMVLVQLAWVPQKLNFLEFGLQTALLVGVIFVIVIFVMLFRFLYARNWVWARVVSCSGGKAIVETEYDFFNGTGIGLSEVSCARKLRKGERVKVRLKPALVGKRPVAVE